MLLICGMQLILLSAGSSYVRPGPAVGISCCGHGRGERDQMASTSVPPQAKAALLGTSFSSRGVVSIRRVFYRTHILKLERYRED